MSPELIDMLALAAKALGWVDFPEDSVEPDHYWYQDKARAPLGPRIAKDCWNPRDDDGDALRLAVALGIFSTMEQFKVFQAFHSDEISSHSQPTAATRYAILYIAAEVGRRMP